MEFEVDVSAGPHTDAKKRHAKLTLQFKEHLMFDIHLFGENCTVNF